MTPNSALSSGRAWPQWMNGGPAPHSHIMWCLPVQVSWAGGRYLGKRWMVCPAYLESSRFHLWWPWSNYLTLAR